MPDRGARLHLPEYMVAAVDGLFGRVLQAEKHPGYASPPVRPLTFIHYLTVARTSFQKHDGYNLQYSRKNKAPSEDDRHDSRP